MLKSSEEGWSSDKNESVASNGVGEGVASNSVTEISSQTVEVDSRSASSRLSGYESDVESVGAESGDKHVSKARVLSAQEIAEISCSNAYNPDNDGRFPILYFTQTGKIVAYPDPSDYSYKSMLLSDARKGDCYIPLKTSKRDHGVLVSKIAKQVGQSLNMNEEQRAKAIQTKLNYDAETGQVSAATRIEKGQLIGVYAGILYHIGHEDTLAQKLDRPAAELNGSAWEMDFRTPSEYLMTGCGVGNMLEHISSAEDDAEANVAIRMGMTNYVQSVEHKPNPDFIAYFATKTIEPGEVLELTVKGSVS